MPRQKTPRVRISDVALAAGVSIGTVSNTINHPARVTEATRHVVWNAIQELGFVPNQSARVLMGLPSKVMGLVLLDAQNPFFMQLAQSVERAARNEGYAVLLGNAENIQERERELLTMFTSHQVRGALITPAGGNDSAHVESPPLPIVHLDHDGGLDACSVFVDHELGGRLAAEHLLAMGHERFGFVYGHPVVTQFEQRRRGLYAAVEAAGLTPHDAVLEVSASGIGVESGEAAAALLLERGMPGAIFCCNDLLAFGVMKQLMARGVRVPEDVSVVGYDDIEFAANWIIPLTTIRQPTRLMGEEAARLLIEHAEASGDHVHRSQVLAPELVIRDSTRPKS